MTSNGRDVTRLYSAPCFKDNSAVRNVKREEKPFLPSCVNDRPYCSLKFDISAQQCNRNGIVLYPLINL